MTATLTAPAPAPAAPAPGRNWTTPALVVLLAGTAVLYLWHLTDSGWGNSYYAAATQAGAQSWTAWLFGGSDAGGVITVDKPPASLWVSGLFARVFGFSGWTVLAPQAIEGVLAVWLLHAAVKRTSGPVAGLMAGTALAVTPVAVLMFRFNLPDALLVLLMVAGAYCAVRATERASAWWLALAGVAVGFAFLTKMGQALLVLPAFTAAYLLAAPTSLGKRFLHLLGAGLALVVSAGWFVLLVEVWPKESRPYIGGSSNDSLWELALGYNGLGRIFGGAGGGMGGGMGNGNIGFGGSTGIDRLFGASMGGEISWLLPAALIGLLAGLWFTRRAPRTDRTRAALVLWGLWVLVNGVVFSFMSGITHPYYTVAAAPGVAAIVAITGRELWRGRAHLPVRVALALVVAAAGFWGFALLNRYPDWVPAVRWTVAALTVLVATAIVMGVRRVAALAAVTAVLSSTAFGVATAATAHSGSIPMSGPGAYADRMGGMGEMGGGTSQELVDLLKGTTGTWAAATVSAQSAAQLALDSGRPVIGIGGWSGGDPAPTLEEFQRYVAEGRIGYYVVGGRGMGGGPGGGGGEIGDWVAANFEETTVGGTTVYKLG
ncbi:ArnT family glycosyltransferase [Saccharothrix syringae]|uniref:Glycosyltransferase family 39 protein n=1 Tax=Saccharothrix syringae TaxID=103733 RepID=A0A5Q0GVN8_SACSY|nr:glycosyltransferase family 39 protein [Saccharothrix syringae]QFZ17991.1 glycosyltransferase family 39 protein [Saccharothrix syringae]